MTQPDPPTWHEQAHVRDMALNYALLLLRTNVLTLANYLGHAKQMYEFLDSGAVPLPADLFVPDDLSGFAESFTPDIDPPLETGVDLPWIPSDEPEL